MSIHYREVSCLSFHYPHAQSHVPCDVPCRHTYTHETPDTVSAFTRQVVSMDRTEACARLRHAMRMHSRHSPALEMQPARLRDCTVLYLLSCSSICIFRAIPLNSSRSICVRKSEGGAKRQEREGVERQGCWYTSSMQLTTPSPFVSLQSRARTADESEQGARS